MNRFNSFGSTLTSVAAMAGASALGAFLIVAQSQAASLPMAKPALVQSPAPIQADTTIEPRRTVRVVYVGPITAR